MQSALLMENALLGIPATEVTNNYGIDMDYVIGTVNQWNVDVQRQMFRTWNVQANYSHTRGSALDVVRAPNRNPNGTLRIDGVQPFYWTSSEGRSELNSASFRVEKREANGLSYNFQYTIAKSRDNAPSGTGGGGGGGGQNVAQNDQDIEAEWGISNFDQRHAFQAGLQAQLPWGQGRPWLSNGGWLAAIVGDWRATLSFNMRSGRPASINATGGIGDIATGLSGTLRANYNGEPIEVDDQSIDRWFNTSAFSRPEVGTFGNSRRNIVYGPGSKDLGAQFSKQVRLANNRNVQVGVNVSNILSLANYNGLDTNINSLTFGQVRGISGNRTATLNLRFSY
jgi:hypothetical protein